MLKKVHHLFLTKIILLFFVNSAFAIESKSYREAIVSGLNRKFASKQRQYVAINGNASSDYNSHNYQLGFRYFYQNPQLLADVNFDCDKNFADVGSGKKKQYNVKTKEQYDFKFNSKNKIFNSPYYVALYQRTLQDYLATNPYDLRLDISLGYIFLPDLLELDLGFGKRKLASFKQQNEVVFSARMQHKINDLISINSRAFAFNNSNSLDYELRNSISYKLNSSFSLEARHNFEKRAYFENNRKYNYVNRSLNFGFIYNF